MTSEAATPESRPQLLLPYQTNYLLDDSPLTSLVKARRIGGTYAATLKVAWSASGYDFHTGGLDTDRGENEYLVSASLAQSEEMLNECVRHLELLEHLHEVPAQMRPYADHAGVEPSAGVLAELAKTATQQGLRPGPLALQRDALRLRVSDRRRSGLIKHANRREIVLVNGRVIAVKAGNYRTLRGIGGNVTLDEYGAMPFSKKVWTAVKPAAGENLINERGFRVRIVGTPLGDGTQFYEIARTDAGKRFSRHEISIWDAVRNGFPIDPEAARAELGDEDAFLQEYCCEFLSASIRYIPDDLLDIAAYDPNDAEYENELLRFHNGGAQKFAGMDVARSAMGDFSALAVVVRVGDVFWLLPDLWADRGVSFTAQKERVRDELHSGVRRVSIDSLGIGMNMAEDLQAQFGDHRVELVPMHGPTKEDLATRLKRLLTQRRLRIPAGEHTLRREILALRREITAAGNTRYDVERTVKGGHGDRAWALMLALHAAESAPTAYSPKLRHGR